MTASSRPEPWLRGPIEGIARVLMPVAHAWLQVHEDVEHAVADLTIEDLWSTPGGAASVGFHLRHLVGSSDRLMTYARGEALSVAQLEALKREGASGDPAATAAELLVEVRAVVDRVFAQLRIVDVGTLQEPRTVGRLALPTTVLGLLFHAAEHAQRHTGQIVTTARIVKGLRSGA